MNNELENSSSIGFFDESAEERATHIISAHNLSSSYSELKLPFFSSTWKTNDFVSNCNTMEFIFSMCSRCELSGIGTSWENIGTSSKDIVEFFNDLDNLMPHLSHEIELDFSGKIGSELGLPEKEVTIEGCLSREGGFFFQFKIEPSVAHPLHVILFMELVDQINNKAGASNWTSCAYGPTTVQGKRAPHMTDEFISSVQDLWSSFFVSKSKPPLEVPFYPNHP